MSALPCDLRVAFYARVSSQRQSKAGTIDSQVEACRQAVSADGGLLLAEDCYIDDGFSGDVLLRPALERLRDRVASGGLDRLYVLCPDRLARRFAHQALLLEEFRHYGVEVVFLNRRLGHSPEDELLVQVQAAVAEFERTKVLERSRRGKLHAARAGRVSVLSTAPYGYRYVTRQQGDGQARFEVVAEQAAVVRQVFVWVGEQRWTIRRVCKELQRRHIATPKGKQRWSGKTVACLLHNPAYKGQAAFGRTQVGQPRPRLRPARGQPEVPRRPRSLYPTPQRAIAICVPALVSEGLFEAAQEQLAENRRRQRQRLEAGKDRYLLSGLVVCGRCGYGYYGKPAGRNKGAARRSYSYYRCRGSDGNRFGGERVCHNK